MIFQDSLSQVLVTYLTGQVSNYQRRVPNDLAQLTATLRPGDVLLVEGDARISQIIMYLTQSSWSHAALYLGDALLRWGGPEAERALDLYGAEATQLLIESDLKNGVSVVPLSNYVEQNLRICRPRGLSGARRRPGRPGAAFQLHHAQGLRSLRQLRDPEAAAQVIILTTPKPIARFPCSA